MHSRAAGPQYAVVPSLRTAALAPSPANARRKGPAGGAGRSVAPGPQQATSPAVVRPQVWVGPAVIWLKRCPAGGSWIAGQQTAAPSGASAQLWSRPPTSCRNGPARLGPCPAGPGPRAIDAAVGAQPAGVLGAGGHRFEGPLRCGDRLVLDAPAFDAAIAGDDAGPLLAHRQPPRAARGGLQPAQRVVPPAVDGAVGGQRAAVLRAQRQLRVAAGRGREQARGQQNRPPSSAAPDPAPARRPSPPTSPAPSACLPARGWSPPPPSRPPDRPWRSRSCAHLRRRSRRTRHRAVGWPSRDHPPSTRFCRRAAARSCGWPRAPPPGTRRPARWPVAVVLAPARQRSVRPAAAAVGQAHEHRLERALVSGLRIARSTAARRSPAGRSSASADRHAGEGGLDAPAVLVTGGTACWTLSAPQQTMLPPRRMAQVWSPPTATAMNGDQRQVRARNDRRPGVAVVRPSVLHDPAAAAGRPAVLVQPSSSTVLPSAQASPPSTTPSPSARAAHLRRAAVRRASAGAWHPTPSRRPARRRLAGASGASPPPVARVDCIRRPGVGDVSGVGATRMTQ